MLVSCNQSTSFPAQHANALPSSMLLLAQHWIAKLFDQMHVRCFLFVSIKTKGSTASNTRTNYNKCNMNEMHANTSPNHMKPWHDSEQQLLMKEVSDGKSLEEIAGAHGSTSGSIRSKLMQMAAHMKMDGESVSHIAKVLGMSDERIDSAISDRQQREKNRSSKRQRRDDGLVSTEDAGNISHQSMVVNLLLDLKAKLFDLERGLEDIKRRVDCKCMHYGHSHVLQTGFPS